MGMTIGCMLAEQLTQEYEDIQMKINLAESYLKERLTKEYCIQMKMRIMNVTSTRAY